MRNFKNKPVLVICLRKHGAKVPGVDNSNLSHRMRPGWPLDQQSGNLNCSSKRIHFASSVFAPCSPPRSLLEAITEAAENATSVGVVLPSPAGSSFDQFRNHQHRGDVICPTVKSIARGVRGGIPIINNRIVTTRQ